MTTVRPAVPGEYVAIRSVLEGALLEVESGLLRRSAVLVAADGGRILGGLVLRGSEIEAIAVRPGRRGQGIGSRLVRAAMARRPSVSAGFDPSLRRFYASLGFEVSCADGRCRGVHRSVGGDDRTPE
jgi:GNAT superfamily N-acetyltransferase